MSGMRIVVDVNHPAHVHCFKNFIRQMEEAGHDLLITASKKDVSLKLLHNYGFPFVNLGSYGTSLFRKLVNLPVIDWKMYRAVKDFNPEILVGAGSIRAAHVSQILRKPCIIFEDTEHSIEQYLLYAPFADCICTPSSFKRSLGKKQITYDGCHELAYLHPNSFTPDPGVLEEIGLREGETFIIVRFVSWAASHDLGEHGIRNKLSLVRVLEQYGRVLIASEAPPETELERLVLKIAPEKFHHLLYYASLYIGEGGTTASEAAVLGTYSLHTSTTAKHCGVYTDLREYGLLEFFDDEEEAIPRAVEILKNPGLRRECKLRRERLLADKIDLTMFMTWLVTGYPQSVQIISANPEYQKRFRGMGAPS